jgi:hypothetical protein
MGIERKNNRLVPSWGTPGFQDSAEVYNCTHMEKRDEPPYTGLGSKGCLTFSNFSLIQPECSTKGLTGFVVNVLDIPDRRHPLASFTDKQVATSYLACRPHPQHVVCTGGYLNLRIPIHGPYYSTSYVVWDPTLMMIYPSLEQDVQVIIKITILGILLFS